MNIPNKIHYCWYGEGKMNHILRLCVKSFSHLGENEIKCWNEENSDIYEHEAIRFLVEKKDWAFVSDYVRLKVLYEHGGIYFDTDIQVIKPLPKEFYEADMIVGYAYDCIMSTAFIMVRSHHPFIKYLLDILEGHLKAGEKVVNNCYFTQAFLDYYPNFKLDGKYREFAKRCFVYPRNYFDSATFDRNAGYCIHHGMGTWHNLSTLKRLVRPLVKLLRFYVKPFGVWYQNRVNDKMVDNAGVFKEIYLKNIGKE